VDAFWTPEEAAFRSIAREHFGRRERSGPVPDLGIPSGLGLGGRVAVVEEASFRDPRLGRGLSVSGAGPGPAGGPVEAVLALARLAGTAAHVVEAGAKAARERGAFSSSLMGCREVQESLAGLVSGAELLRFGACRLCRLLDRGDGDRVVAESVRFLDGAKALAGDVRAVALSLLGAPWVAENLAGDDLFVAHERTDHEA
jgi:hypothetical protein